MPNYLDVVYNKEKRPHTDYPSKLAGYLFERFHMQKGDRFLDIGCGRGDFTKAFKDLGLQVAGIDREKGDSEFLQDIDVRIQEDLGNSSFPFPDNSFDVVFSKSVIEHIRGPENFMKEQLRVLKPDGRIIAMVPDWHSQMFIFYDDPTHVHPYTAVGLSDLFSMHGFQNVQSELFYQLPILWKYPFLKFISQSLQLLGPVKKIYTNKFIRWSRELMILASGTK
jgi:SAM-dependent methyltransferase